MLVKMMFVLLISAKTLICMRFPNALLKVKKLVWIPCLRINHVMDTKDHPDDKLTSCFKQNMKSLNLKIHSWLTLVTVVSRNGAGESRCFSSCPGKLNFS